MRRKNMRKTMMLLMKRMRQKTTLVTVLMPQKLKRFTLVLHQIARERKPTKTKTTTITTTTTKLIERAVVSVAGSKSRLPSSLFCSA